MKIDNHPIISFIGCGHMVSSIITGLLSSSQIKPNQIWASDPNKNKLQMFDSINITSNNEEAAKHADVLILGVLPNILPTIANEIAEIVNHKKCLIISIAAGLSCDTLQEWFGKEVTIIRCMPNIAVKIREGVLAFYADKNISKENLSLVDEIFKSIGLTIWLPDEKLLDIITVISGCGPAYFLLVMEAIQATAIKMGIDSESAKMLIIQTALGTTKMSMSDDCALETQRRSVCPPGGVTEQAILSLEMSGIREMFEKALKKAKMKVDELSNN